MASTRLKIGTLMHAPAYDDVVRGLESSDPKGNYAVFLHVKNPGNAANTGSIQIEFGHRSPTSVSTLDDKGRLASATVNKATLMKVTLFLNGENNSRVEVSQGPSKVFDHVQGLLRELVEKTDVQVDHIPVSPIATFRKLQALFEKTGGAVVKSLRFSDYSETEGVTVRGSVKIGDESLTEDTVENYEQHSVIQAMVVSFKTQAGKMRLTLSGTADFRFSCKEQAKDIGLLICRKLAREEQITEADVTPQKAQAS